MYLKKFEYFILDSSVAGTLLLMALAIRIEAINAGFDQFSSNIIFISVFIISTGLYISMQIALYEIISRPLKSPFLRDIVQVQYLAYFLKHAQKSFHSSFEVICCCREKYVHSISYHTLIKVAAQTIIRL